mmetsp:Transcript_18713/g.55159  ORF Transcript_18713/g.55159 Transcript_18713/m.55159 type:complete len:279 (+) Transcript_18713:408-1244(+)
MARVARRPRQSPQLRAGEAVVGRDAERAVDDLDNLPRHSVGERRVPSGGGRSDELVERGGGEGERTAGHLVQEDAERPDVARGAEGAPPVDRVAAVAGQPLRRCVRRCADAALLWPRSDAAREAPVGEDRPVEPRGEAHVCGLEVAVHKAARVRVSQAGEEVAKDEPGGVERQPAPGCALQQLGELGPANLLHHDVVRVDHLNHVHHPHHVPVPQLREHVHLPRDLRLARRTAATRAAAAAALSPSGECPLREPAAAPAGWRPAAPHTRTLVSSGEER